MAPTVTITKAALVLFLSIAGLLASCSDEHPEHGDHHHADGTHEGEEGSVDDTTRNSIDWSGRYVGTIPCSNCPGTKMVLTINAAGYYSLSEIHIGEDDPIKKSEGEFSWDKTGSIIELKGNEKTRRFMIGEGFASLLDAKGQVGKEDDALVKLNEFNGDGKQLFIYPDTVSVSQNNEQMHINFSGLMNVEHKTEDGYQSILADFEINCHTMKITMPFSSYFSNLDGKGKQLNIDHNNDQWQSVGENDSVTKQAADYYCI